MHQVSIFLSMASIIQTKIFFFQDFQSCLCSGIDFHLVYDPLKMILDWSNINETSLLESMQQ